MLWFNWKRSFIFENDCNLAWQLVGQAGVHYFSPITFGCALDFSDWSVNEALIFQTSAYCIFVWFGGREAIAVMASPYHEYIDTFNALLAQAHHSHLVTQVQLLSF